MRRSRLRVAYLVLHLSFLSQVLCPHTKSRPAAGQSIKDEVQSTTYSSSSTPERGDTWRNAYQIVEPRESSSRLKMMTPNPSSQGGKDNSVLAMMHDEDKATWLVDDAILKAVNGSIHSIVNCTSEHDTILIETNRTLTLQTTLTIPWNLTLSGFVEGTLVKNGTFTKAKDKVNFTCPVNGSLIVAKTPSFTLANVMISGCNIATDIVLLEPSCTDTQGLGRAQLVHIDFKNNSLHESGSLINGSRAVCTKMYLEEVEFNQNTCDGEGCILLSPNSTLQDIRVLHNCEAADCSDDCSMFSTQDKSQVDIRNMSGMHNEVRVLYFWNSMVTILESLFEGNIRRKSSTPSYEDIGGGIVLADQSSLSIQSSTFRNNSAISGGTIFATFSEINVGNCTFHQNHATKGQGGAIFAENGEGLNLSSSNFTDNFAKDSGGAIHTLSVSSTLKDCKFIRNNASIGGACVFLKSSFIEAKGVIFDGNQAYPQWCGAVLVSVQSTLQLYDSTLQNNKAERGAGAICGGYNSNMKFTSVVWENNTAGISGGSIRVQTSTNVVIFRSFFSNNRATTSGGAIYAIIGSTIRVSRSRFNTNYAEFGGCIFVERDSNLTISQSSFEGNEAEETGGAITSSDRSILNLVSTNFTRNSAKQGGGALHTTSSTSSLRDCKFIRNNASFGGACVFQDNSSICAEGTLFDGNRAYLESGGAIDINSNTTLCTTNLTIKGNKAEKNSGGISIHNSSFLNATTLLVMSNSASDLAGGIGIFDNSSFLCYSCIFKNNTSLDGAGIYVRTLGKKYSTVAELHDSKFASNCAGLSGGGLMFEGPQNDVQNSLRQVNLHTRVVLLNTSFVDNSATLLGSAILVTNVEDVLVSCAHKKGKQERSLDYGNSTSFHCIHPKHLCKSWKGNHLATSHTKGVVGTFGKVLSLRMDSTNSSSEVRLIGNETAGFILENMLSGGRLPLIRILVVDEFGNIPAPSVPRSFLIEITAPDELRLGIVSVTITNGTGNFSNIPIVTPPGTYPLNINPKIETIREALLRVHVRTCLINEEHAQGDWSCRACGENSYNFDPIGTHRCLRCPEKATCQDRYIVPKNGYWHKGPCHSKVKKCIVEEACTYDNRLRNLSQFGAQFTNCELSNENLTGYAQILCSKKYEGPLCGSCAKGFGMSGNFDCLKCGLLQYSVLRLLGIILYLFVGTVLTIKGTLPIVSKRLLRQDAMTPLLASASSSSMEEGTSAQIGEVVREQTSSRIEEASQGGIDIAQVAMNEEQVVDWGITSQLAFGVEKAQVHLIETWKILINFFQVSSTAATMNVKWTQKILRFFKTLSLLSAATINSVSRPIDCIMASSSISRRVVWRYLFNILVPTIVITILSIYWGYRSLTRHRSERSHFLKRLVLVVITVTYITYFDITKVAVNVFNCVNVYDTEHHSSSSMTRYWVVDTSIKCYKGTHVVLIGISLVILSIVSLCFPLACSWALFKTKDEVQINNSRAHETLGLLCGPFKEKFVFWECVTMLKKALLSIIIVFSYSLGNQPQGLLISIVLVLFLSLHITCYPFKVDFNSLNYYESGSLLTSCITYTLVQFFNVETLSEDARTIVSIVLIILNGGFVSLMAFLIIRNLVRLAKAILLSNNVAVLGNMGWVSIGMLYFKNRKFIGTNT